MKKLIFIVTIAFTTIVNAQRSNLDPKILSDERVTVNSVINVFNTLNSLYFDETIEQHFYKHVSKLNYLSFSNDPNSVLVHQYVQDQIESGVTSYGTNNLFADKQIFKDLQDSRIFDIQIDTTTMNNENRQTYNYAFSIDISYEKDGVLKSLLILFQTSYSKIVIITTLTGKYEV